MSAAIEDRAAINAGWRERGVSDLCVLTNGFPFDSELFSSSGDLPLVRIRDILSSEFETYVSAEATPKSAEVSDGDLIVGMDGDFNQVLWNRGRAALNQRLCILRPRPGTDLRFLHYTLPSQLKIINDLTYSTTVKHLSSGQILAIRLPAPPEREQRQIADYLDRETGRIDALITKQQQLIETLAERVRSVRSMALSSETTDVSLGLFAEVQSGYAFKSEGFTTSPDATRLLRGVNVNPGRITWDDEVRWSREAGDGLGSFALREGDIEVFSPGMAA